MSDLRRVTLTAERMGAALAALDSWTPPLGVGGSLHAGDIGWAARFEDCAVHLWTEGGSPVAVGYLDGPVLRMTVAPGTDGERLAADALALVGDGDAWCDGLGALEAHGWRPETDDPWVELVLPAAAVPATDHVADLAAEDVADRVAVQRSAFEKSTFTVERWHTMRASPAAGRCVEVLVRTDAGEPASAVTGWLAGPGRCALIEPMGSHPSHRGRGYGRQALQRVSTALVQRGASGVAVVTPAANTAAVALYRSAGFTPARELCALRRH